MERKRMLGIVVGVLVCVPAVSDSAEHGGKEHGGQSTATPQEHQGSGAGSAPTAPPSRQGGEGQAQSMSAPSKAPTIPTGQVATTEPSPEQIRQAIRDDIHQTEQKDGAFTIKDQVTGNIRTLSLVRVHDRVGKTGELYYSCTDMHDVDSGELLDLDFDVDARTGAMDVVDVRIHKVNGKARYTYDEKDNRIPLKI
ncbi:MAG: hypothetical protein HYZ89_00930 [Candidatus Omnitrophica bacterium]|nr:hypothetical protein [Candidatus Omnitrophota bacterium]